jgi:hypothetical protein
MENYMKARDTVAVLKNSTFCLFKINVYPVTKYNKKKTIHYFLALCIRVEK